MGCNNDRLDSISKSDSNNLNLSFSNHSYPVRLDGSYLDDLELIPGSIYRLNITRCQTCIWWNCKDWKIINIELLKVNNKTIC